MNYRGIKVDKEVYFKVLEKMKNFIMLVSFRLNIPLENLNCEHIQKYCEEYLGYCYAGFNFSDLATGYIKGSIIKKDNEIVIGYNINPKIPQEQQNFTKMHETSHSLQHIDSDIYFQQFSEISGLNGYHEEEKILEVEADFGASILLINDWALYTAVVDLKMRFYDIVHKFFISATALKLRIKNFLVYNCDCTEYAAEIFVINYIKYNEDYVYTWMKNNRVY